MGQAPGGIIIFGPTAEIAFGGEKGQRRRSVVEVKGAISSLVVAFEPGAVLLGGRTLDSLDAYDHLTVHRDLMVHATGDGGSKLLTPASVVDGQLVADAVHLASVSAPPAGLATGEEIRRQSKWEGGVAMLPLIADNRYDQARTHAIVDLWACRPDGVRPGELPLVVPASRIALQHDACASFEVGAAWAFRVGAPPPCIFRLRFAFREFDGIPGPIVFASGMQLTRET